MTSLGKSVMALVCVFMVGCVGGVASPGAPTPTVLAASAVPPRPTASPAGATAAPALEAVCRRSQGSGPSASPHPNDGAPDPAGRIVFGKLSYVNERGQVVAPLFAIDPDGSDLAQLFECDVERPRVSRDGTRLAFSVVMSDGSWQLATSSIDGSDLRILTSTPPGEQAEKTGTPDWSPDGTWLVFANSHTMWRIDEDGSNARLIGDPEGFDWEPRFSPDGESIVFLHGDFTKGVSEPWILDLARGEQRPVSATNDRELEHPDWSPDGAWIIYNTLGQAGESGESIERMPSDDPDATPEVLYGSEARHFAAKPVYSPDGKWIAFGCDGKLCVMAADGTDVRVLFSAPNFEVNHIAWGVTPT